MLYVDIPTLTQLKALATIRSDACVSLYLATTPQTQHIGAAQIAFRNLAKQALDELQEAGLDKRRLAGLDEQFEMLRDDDDFWRFQATGLCVLATPETLTTYRLPTTLVELAETADRFFLKPLLRAATFPQGAFVLALAEGGPRLIEMFGDQPATEVRIAEMPKDAGSAVGRSSINDRSPSGRLAGLEGQKVLMGQFARKVDAAIRPLLTSRAEPLIIAAAEPLMSIYRGINTYPGLAAQGLSTSSANMTPGELAAAARPILDALHAARISDFTAHYALRNGQGRATADISSAARAATMGAIESLMVAIDEIIPGTVDDETGAVSFADAPGAESYGVVDEIAARALAAGATVLGVRKADIPGGASLAATLRFAA